MNDSIKWLPHDYSLTYILDKILVCRPNSKAFKYAKTMITHSVLNPKDNYIKLLVHVSRQYGVSVSAIKLTIAMQLWMSLVFRRLDVGFLNMIEGDNQSSEPIWKRQTNSEYLISIISAYIQDRTRSNSKYTWNSY